MVPTLHSGDTPVSGKEKWQMNNYWPASLAKYLGLGDKSGKLAVAFEEQKELRLMICPSLQENWGYAMNSKYLSHVQPSQPAGGYLNKWAKIGRIGNASSVVSIADAEWYLNPEKTMKRSEWRAYLAAGGNGLRQLVADVRLPAQRPGELQHDRRPRDVDVDAFRHRQRRRHHQRRVRPEMVGKTGRIRVRLIDRNSGER